MLNIVNDRTKHRDIERSLSRTLSELTLEFELKRWISEETALVNVGHRGFGTVYQLAWLPRPSLSAVSRLERDNRVDPLLVAGPHISSRTATALRNAHIDYIDYAGNAHLSFGPVLIDIRGRHGPAIDSRGPSTETSGQTTDANLFSTRRMQVIFVLLAWPSIAKTPVRAIAEAAGTSVGITQSTLEIMREADYLIGRKLRRRDELLDLWTAAFRNSLLPKIRQNSFSGNIENWSPPPGYLISGESAVELIRRPETLTVYVEQFDRFHAVENGWRKSDDPNIEIRRKFWKEPREMTSPDRYKAFARAAAPPILVYADLLASNEPRQCEVARTLRKDRLV